jgi:hypothetical protein
MSEYTEHERLKAVAEESQAIGSFLTYLLTETGHVLAKWDGQSLRVSNTPITDLLAGYYGIDQNKIEQEKRQMLQRIRGQLRG